ncbi:hypothetical protein NDU88_002603 [Pleurodeles waltl]|uniref:Uncharacterized protein n=1 Tax=Pleurodeles waltl TaxID=8319 RepID=A0AAV7TMB0_PLEWA|nr:hypothetical protein NDU88_002603 [Pleurodeles waltl]
MVTRLLHYRKWDALLQRAQEAGSFVVENGRVNMFPDFTAAVQAKWLSCMEVKKVLRAEGIQYSLLLPLKLKIMLEGYTHSCQTTEKAWAWLESHTSGTDRPRFIRPQAPKRRRKRRPLRDREEGMTKPTPQQVDQKKRAALRATASLTESGHFSGEKGNTTDVPESDMFDLDSMVSTLEGAPHVMPQTATDLT